MPRKTPNISRLKLILLLVLPLCFSSCNINYFMAIKNTPGLPADPAHVPLLKLINQYRETSYKNFPDNNPEFFRSRNTQGALFSRDGNLYIIFFGSDEAMDLYLNLSTMLVPASFLWENTRVHHGFLTYYENVRDYIISRVEDYCSDGGTGQIHVLGHSSGGAVAAICAADLCRNIPQVNTPNLLCITAASPRPGDTAFAREFSAGNINCHRYVNGSDMVPSMPPADAGFSHVGVYHHIGPKANSFTAASFLWLTHHFIGAYCESL